MTESARVTGVVLAAGSSRRLGRPKQLVDIGGAPLVRRTVEAALVSAVDDWIVVLGASQDAVAEALHGLPVRLVINPQFAEGQSTSVVAGVTEVPSDAAAVVFVLGDQPMFAPGVIDQLVQRYGETRAEIVQPTYSGTPGNPVLVSTKLREGLLALTGDEGARPLLRQHAGAVERVEVGGAVPSDVDTEEDVARVRAEWFAAQ